MSNFAQRRAATPSSPARSVGAEEADVLVVPRSRRPGDAPPVHSVGMRRFQAGVVVVLLGLATLLVAPTPSAAQSEVDRCTAVPDSGRTFDFTDACADHDRCYLERPDGDSSDDRRQCDRDFYAAMVDHCETAWPDRSDFWSRRACRGVAWLYYLGVRWFGGFAWNIGTDAPVAV